MSHAYIRGWISRRSTVLAVVLLVSLTVGIVVTAPTPTMAQEASSSVNVTEDEYVEEAPEPGDEYFEAEASDGRWISYSNPRDEYRDPYLGDGSGKICTVLLNEAGNPIVGETVPETTVTVPTGDSLEWHSSADPMAVDYPLTEHYDRPLDADQFGTAEDIGQGDGYMDSHCIEFHGPAIGDEIEYGHATVDGAHADRIEVVGYIQRDGDTWETDIDPLEAATSYEEAGGGWTFREGASHGQVVVVLQLASDESDEANETDETGDTTNETTQTVDASAATNQTNTASTDGDAENATVESTTTEELPGFGIFGTVVAMLAVIVGARVSRQ